MSGPTDEVKKRFRLLDWNHDDLITREDLVLSFLHIARYPTRQQIDDCVLRLGNGTIDDFCLALDDPLLQIENLYDDLAIMRDTEERALLEGKAYSSNTFISNLLWMLLLLFGFPLNLVFGRSWTRRIGWSDEYHAWYVPTYMYALTFVYFMGLVMVTLHLAYPGNNATSTILVYFGSLVLLASTTLVYESLSALPKTTTANRKLHQILQACWYQDVFFSGPNGTVKRNLRDFFVDAIGGAYVKYSAGLRDKTDPMQVLYLKHFKRNITRPSIVHSEESAARYKQYMDERTELRQEIYPRDHKRDNVMGVIISVLVLLAEIFQGNLKSANETDIFALVLLLLMFIFVLPRAFGVIFHLSRPIAQRSLERAVALNDLLTMPNPYVERTSPLTLNLAKLENASALDYVRKIMDLCVEQSQTDTGFFTTLGMAVSLLSLVVAAAVVFTSKSSDMISALFNKVFVYFAIQAIYGLFCIFPVLGIAIKHNHAYNKVFSSCINDRIVDIIKVVTAESSTIPAEFREEMTRATSLLRAIHDSVVEHPTYLRVFGVPVTQAVYARLLALILSLGASMVARFALAK